MPLGYRVLGWVLFGFWAAMSTQLVLRDLVPDDAPLPTAGYKDQLAHVELARPRVERIGMYLAGKRLGTSVVTRTRLETGGFRIEGTTDLALDTLVHARLPALSQLPGGNLLDGLVPKLDTVAWVDDEYHLERFDIAVTVAGATHHVLGEQLGSGLVVTTDLGGKAESRTLPFDGQAVLGMLLVPAESPARLKIGNAWAVRNLDPMTGTTQTARRHVARRERIAVAGRIHDCYVIHTEVDGKATTTTWVDVDGALVREERPFGLRLEREDP